ncbi:hypothetical protein PG993_009212 [Apiospora rasikravindrae]|uniref:Uncharacterized protein n=1 Tax=Apiospora rasikravindrae TaxID=990691 RepID=A0ABR1SIQ8_9PEZI
MDPARLLDVDNDKVVPYFNELRQQGLSDLKIGEELLHLVKSETLPPHLLAILLSWSKSAELLTHCLLGEEAAASRGIRRVALRKLGYLLADPTIWEKIWQALGGTVGIVDLFARSSVEDVKVLASAISFGGRKLNKPAEQAAAVADLLRALVPSHYKSDRPSTDKRPIQHNYARMVRACDQEFLGELLRSQDKSNPLYAGCNPKRIEIRHGAWMQKQVVDMLCGHIHKDDNLQSFLNICVAREPSMPTDDHHVSESMAFSLRLLRGRLDGTFQDKWWQNQLDELQILRSVFNRMEKKGAKREKLNELAVFAMDLAEAKPKLRASHNLRFLWNRLVALWKKEPTEQHEKMVAKGLRWGLDSGSAMSIGRDCRNRMILLQDDLKWPLLRLYCLHVPEKGIDIDTAQDLRVIAKQKWPYELFEQLIPVVPQKVIGLLKRLLDANPDYSFLSPPDGKPGFLNPHYRQYDPPTGPSILSLTDLVKQRNFNVELLLTMLQREDTEFQRKVAVDVDNLRKKSVTARDQGHRAQYAKGAAALAIATGDLNLYADTITWQQRFVRDPLTVKVIFAKEAVQTREGIELLSGIPKDLPVGCTLEDLVKRMDIADGILLTLRDCHKEAKAEPSFFYADWNAVESLFDSVFTHRYWHLQNIPKRLDVSDADVFTITWDRTMKMVEALGADFLVHITRSIDYYIRGLPPTSLAIAAKTLLETDIKRRERKDRKKEDRHLESLSYTALLKLAESDKPRLAHDLILQTILERPDASSWHRQFLSSGYLKRLQAKDAQDILFGLARGIGEKLEEQSFVKVGEAEPAKHAPPRSLVKVTTVKHLAQLLDNADYISVEAAVEVLAELFKVATHRDIRIATLQSLSNVLTKLGPGDDGLWESNPLAMKVLTAIETVIPVAASVNGRFGTDWEAALQHRELPEVSEDSEALVREILMRDGLGSYNEKDGKFSGIISAYAERIVGPLWKASMAEHRRWVEVFLLKYDAPVSVRDLPNIPTHPETWTSPLQKYWRLLPFEALETFHRYTVWYYSRPEALRKFSAALRSNSKLRKQPDVVHFLHIYDSNLLYGVRATVQSVRAVKTTEPALSRLLVMQTEQCAAMLGDYEDNVDGWHEVAITYHPPATRKGSGPSAADRAAGFAEWNCKGRVVLERMAEMVAARKEANRKQGKHSLLPSAMSLSLWLNPFTGVPNGGEVDGACRGYATSLRQTFLSLLEGGNHLQWHKVAEEAKPIEHFMISDEEQLRVAVYLGQLATDTTTTTRSNSDNTLSALNLVQVSVAMHLIRTGRHYVTNTKDDKEEKAKSKAAEKRRLAGSLGELVGTWLRSEDEMVRDLALEWKREQRELVAALEKEAAV